MLRGASRYNESIISPRPFSMFSNPVRNRSISWLTLAGAFCGAGLVGCASSDFSANRVVNMVSVYKVEVVQGNFISSEQVKALKPGMSRTQVREILGTPLLGNLFRSDRWDYVFTMKRQGVEPQARKLVVFFKGEALERFESDDMPSEAEFVAKLESGRAPGKIPPLQASEESLRKYAPEPKPAAAPAAPLAPIPTTYPPLESPAR